MIITPQDTIGNIVARDIRSAEVFRKLGIDFCCGGGLTLERMCTEHALNPVDVIASIMHAVAEKETRRVNFDMMPASLLADYIVQVHHSYAEANIPVIRQYLDKIVSVHGTSHPELPEIRDLFYEVSGELVTHMKKEEFVLFPFIRKLSFEPAQAVAGARVSVDSPIAAMMDDHQAEGDKLKRIRQLASDFNCPADACNTYKLVFSLLQDFESDIHVHMHLENNVLFPKASLLEKTARLNSGVV